jgi:hypothetical protein
VLTQQHTINGFIIHLAVNTGHTFVLILIKPNVFEERCISLQLLHGLGKDEKIGVVVEISAEEYGAGLVSSGSFAELRF